jgi:NagD protein
MTIDGSAIRYVAFDMDGTIYLGDKLFAETIPCLAMLARLGIGYTFITNNCSKSQAEYHRHLRAMGLDVEGVSVTTSAQATASLLRSQCPGKQRLFVLGAPGLVDDLVAEGFLIDDVEPEVVVVGFDLRLSYERLCRTAYLIKQGLPYLATHPDRVCPTNLPTVLPDCGAVCALFESATGRKPDAIAGKPNPSMLAFVMEKHRLRPDEIMVVGDRPYTDIALAKAAGSIGVLTLTGEATRESLSQIPPASQPDIVINHLGELQQLLEAASK